jgi:hypothetical protein
MDIPGTMSVFPIKGFNRIGKAGATIDTGKRRKLGTSVITNPEHSSRDMK